MQIEADSLQQATIRAELARIGLRWANCATWNASPALLTQLALDSGEGKLTATGALAVSTGQHTGRSPKDKFIVRDATTMDNVWWDNNQAISPQHFDVLRSDMMAYARLKGLHVQDLEAGADSAYRLNVRVITELAWHSLFIRHLLRVPGAYDSFAPELSIINLPGFKADPARHGTRSETVIAFDLNNRLVLIGGTQYAGETKKAVFTVMNYVLPQQGVLPMHCSANVGKAKDAAIFFGLSGTGKTTLSTDPNRSLIGDDEHGWSEHGIFNIEGGCYAKVIKLSPEAEPEIHHAAMAESTVLENVVLNAAAEPDFNDAALTENTRAAYPLAAIRNADATGVAGRPKAVIMLTADAFGVLPAIARLNPEEAMTQFLLGYTAKLAGTERGVKEPQATFSACFGAPFLPRHPQVYAAMLKSLIEKHNVPCYLVNTGWTGGAYGVGKRFAIKDTRALLNAALDGTLARGNWRREAHFGLEVPVAVPGIAESVIDPAKGWNNPDAYAKAAKQLAGLFAQRMEKLNRASAPLRIAAQ